MKTLTLLLCAPLLCASLHAQQPAPPPATPEPSGAPPAPAQPGTAQPAPAPAPREPKADPFTAGTPGTGNPAPAPGSEAGAADPVQPSPAERVRQSELLTTWVCFTMKPTVARRAVIAHPLQADLYQWCTAQAAVAESGVKMEFISSLPCRSGQRSKTENLVEYPFPTEFDPPQIPQSYGVAPAAKEGESPQPLPPAPASAPAADPGQIPPAPVPGAGEMQIHPFRNYLAPWPGTPSTPQSFQYRNTGLTIEVECTMDERRTVADMNVAPDSVRVLSVIPWSFTGDIVQPCFGTRKIATQIQCALGEPTLAGTFSRASGTGVPGTDAEPSTSLLFLTITQP